MTRSARTPKPPATPLGLHWMVEAHACTRALLQNQAALEEAVRDACRAGGWTVKLSHFFRYDNGGISGLAVLAESHLSLHTWPEHRYASIDLFVCRIDRRSLRRTIDLLLDRLECRRWTVSEVVRGHGGGSDETPALRTWEGARSAKSPSARRRPSAPRRAKR